MSRARKRPAPAMRVEQDALAAHGMITLFGRPWSRGRLRKPAKCHLCVRHLNPGETAFRPVVEGSQAPRSARICEGCAEEHRKRGSLIG